MTRREAWSVAGPGGITRRQVAALGICVAFAAHAHAQDEKPSPATAPVRLETTFAWPTPGQVLVTKEGTKAGKTATLRYRLELAEGTDGEIVVRHRDFEFLTVGGLDATTPAMREQLEPALALTQAVPDVVVSKRGEYLRIDGLEAMVERFSELGKAKNRDPKQTQRILQSLRSPKAIELMQNACGDDWRNWVEAWHAFPVAPGETVNEDATLPFLEAQLPAKVARTHHGAAEGSPGHVRLSMTTRIEGDEARTAFGKQMQGLVQGFGTEPFPVERLESLRVETRAEVVIDPTTMRPLRASRTKTIHMTIKGEAPRDRIDSSAFTFDWSVPAKAPR